MKLRPRAESGQKTSEHSTRTRVAAGVLAVLMLGGCTSTVAGQPKADPWFEESYEPKCDNKVFLNLAYGLDPEELPALIGNEGDEARIKAWAPIKESSNEQKQWWNVPPTAQLSLGAGVGTESLDRLEQAHDKANSLVDVGTEELGATIAGRTEGYHGQENIGTLWIKFVDKTCELEY